MQEKRDSSRVKMVRCIVSCTSREQAVEDTKNRKDATFDFSRVELSYFPTAIFVDYDVVRMDDFRGSE